MTKYILIGVVVVGLAVGGWFFMNSKKTEESAKAENPKPVKVGVILPLTGDAAVYGEPARNMISMAAEEVNKLGGTKLEFVYEDGKCNGKDAANAAQKLINVDGVKVIIGGFCSSESLAVVPVAAEAKVAVFSPGSSSPNLTNSSPFFFRNYPSDASQGKVLADVAHHEKSWKKVALIQEQTDYAVGITSTFTAGFEGLGGSVVKEEFPTSANDFRSSLSKLKATKPDALFINTQTPAAAERILKQVQELKWTVPLVINDAISGDPKMVETNKAVLEGALTAEFGTNPENPRFRTMIENYKTKYGSEPPYQSYAQTEYDAVYMVRDAIEFVGNDGEKIAAWSRTVKDWDGASGKVTIQEDGDRAGGHSVRVIKDGKVQAQ